MLPITLRHGNAALRHGHSCGVTVKAGLQRKLGSMLDMDLDRRCMGMPSYEPLSKFNLIGWINSVNLNWKRDWRSRTSLTKRYQKKTKAFWLPMEWIICQIPVDEHIAPSSVQSIFLNESIILTLTYHKKIHFPTESEEIPSDHEFLEGDWLKSHFDDLAAVGLIWIFFGSCENENTSWFSDC